MITHSLIWYDVVNRAATFNTHRLLKHPASLILLLFCLILILFRLHCHGPILELDEAEQIIRAEHLLPGYFSQPPLYSWLQYAVFQVLGINLLSLVLLKYSLVFASLYCYHLICRQYCDKPLIAWCATCTWALIPAMSVDLLKDNTHTILALFCTCATWLSLTAPSRLSPLFWYGRLGIVIACGLLAKFNYILFLLVFLLALLSVPSYRVKMLTWRFLISLSVAAILVFPYAQWLFYHADIGLNSVGKLTPEGKTFWSGFIGMTKACLLFILPPLFISWLFFSSEFKASFKKDQDKLLKNYHLICLPMLVLLLLSGHFTAFETRWLIPIFCLLPLLLFSQLKARTECEGSKKSMLGRFFAMVGMAYLGEERRAKNYLIFCLIVQLIIVLSLFYRSNYGHHYLLRRMLLEEVQKIVHSSPGLEKLSSPSYWLLANLRLQPEANKLPLELLMKDQALPERALVVLIVWEGYPEEQMPAYSKPIIDPNSGRVLARYVMPTHRARLSACGPGKWTNPTPTCRA